MQKSEKSSEEIKIKIAVLGGETQEIELPKDSTVKDAMNEADLSLENGQEAYVEGVLAEEDDILDDGDILSVVAENPKGGN